MEIEKKRTKGGFFGLFDWHGKSKKKLFANNTESNGQTNREREIEENTVKSRRHVVTEVDGFGSNLVYKGGSDFSSSSSVTSDRGCENKAPGVVARLMGLDSLPTSNVDEPHSTPLCETSFISASHYEQSTANLWNDYHPTDYLMISKKEGPSWNLAEPRLHKVLNRPLDRFQTEVLPPKSAKPISITHHKLLSPIKSPGFIPTNNAAYIMEAAAKIIEPSPLGSRNNRVPSIGSSSVPLRIRDLKDKMEAVHRASRTRTAQESIANKGKPNDRSRSNSAYSPALMALADAEERIPERSKAKGKSVSLAVQAKVNVQRRDRATSGSINNSTNQERNRVKRTHNLKSEPNIQKTKPKRTSANRNSNVLRQNNHKQNSVSNKDKSLSKASVSVQQMRKSQSINGSAGTNKTVKRVAIISDIGSRTTSPLSNDTPLQPSFSKQKSSTRKKRSLTCDSHFGEGVADNVLTNKAESYVKPDASVGAASCNKWSSDGKSEGTDIVSFTFTSPIKRTSSECHSSSQAIEEAASKNSCMDSSADKGQSQITESELSSGSNMISGDALSILLEQKLKELVDKVDLSKCNLVNTENSANSVSSACSTTTEMSMSYVVSSSFMEHIDIEGSELDLPVNVSDCMDNERSLTLQEPVDVDECSTGSPNAETDELFCWHPSPHPNRQISVAVGDCSTNKDITEGNKWCSLTQVHEDFNCLYKKSPQSVKCETDVLDSASSLSAGDELRNYTSRITETKRSCNWELEYVRNIINNAELMLEDFTIGQAEKVISPDHFYHFENQEGGTQRYGGECFKITRNVLFDGISECLETRCGQSFTGCKAWNKWSALYKSKGLLAEELYREILSWQSMEDLMMDELIDKDMSTRHGGWLYFDSEAFEEGIEIEKEIINNLVNELVKDLYF